MKSSPYSLRGGLNPRGFSTTLFLASLPLRSCHSLLECCGLQSHIASRQISAGPYAGFAGPVVPSTAKSVEGGILSGYPRDPESVPEKVPRRRAYYSLSARCCTSFQKLKGSPSSRERTASSRNPRNPCSGGREGDSSVVSSVALARPNVLFLCCDRPAAALLEATLTFGHGRRNQTGEIPR